MKYWRLLIILLNTEYWILNTARADLKKHLSEGDKAAKAFLDQMKTKEKEAGAHPFYKGISKESKYQDTELKGRAQTAANKDPAMQMIYESSKARPQVKIDPQKDPLITGSQKVMETPLEVIGGKGTQVLELEQGGKTETVFCEESGEDSLETCTRDLTVKVEKTKVQKETSKRLRLTGCKKSHKNWHIRSCPDLLKQVQQWKPNKGDLKKSRQVIDVTAAFKACLKEVGSGRVTRCPRCHDPRTFLPTQIKGEAIRQVIIERDSTFQPLIEGKEKYSDHGRLKKYDLYASVKIIYEKEEPRVLPDEWSDTCARLEGLVDNGLCGYHSKVCTQKRQKRIINGVPITRDCWQETMTYHCSYPAKDDCGPLRARGCAQTNSVCKQKVGHVCVVYQQTYQCKEPPRTIFQIQGGNTPFCLDGNCRDQSWDKNNEMMSSVAQLSILKEMQGKFKDGFLFKGAGHKCSKYVLSFKDCCGSGKGWGKDLGLGSCKADEKLLNMKRKQNLCHRVGTYCSKRELGVCRKKKTSFCCFGSRLLKAFHEQGRAQIGMNWGSSENPLCRGFTIQEIQRIDFSKLDLREVFEELMKNYTPSKMKNITRQVGERLEVIKRGMVPDARKAQPKQREGGA